MGGYGSSRWGMTLTRFSTDGLLRLDVQALEREGGLVPGKAASIMWGDAASITAEVRLDAPDVVTLSYFVRTSTDGWLPIQEHVSLISTPCTFGGNRVWLACPGCGNRRAVLYALAGRFRCRTCHNIAYASTRTIPAPRGVHHSPHVSSPRSDDA